MRGKSRSVRRGAGMRLLAVLGSVLFLFSAIMIRPSLFEAAESGTVGDCSWSLSDDGTLTITGPGTLPNAGTHFSDPDTGASKWPWYSCRDNVKEVVIGSGVAANKEARFMFCGMKNLTKADLSALDATRLGVGNDMFRDCAALTAVKLPGSFVPSQMNRMFQDCAALTTITWGTADAPLDPKGIRNARSKDGYGYLNILQQMTDTFKGCVALKTLEMPGAKFGSHDDNSVNRFTELTAAFDAANTLAKTLRMPSAEFCPYMAHRIFHMQTLAELYLQGTLIRSNIPRNLFHQNGKTVCDAPMLKTIDLSGSVFQSESADTVVNASQIFTNMTALEKVILTNADFTNARNFLRMFANSKMLTSVVMNTGTVTPSRSTKLSVGEAVTMAQMFEDCSALTTLDVSGFGKLPKIVSMNRFVNGCASLQTLVMDGLDNSRIRPTNANHPASATDTGAAAESVDWGRELMIDTCTALKVLSAKGSKIWMVPNSSGNPGSEYYNAAYDSDIYYFTQKAMSFLPDAGKPDDSGAVTPAIIDSKRDYIDLIIDRDGKDNVHTNVPAVSPLPDAKTNINIKNGDLNPNGPGFLAPGVYTLTGDYTPPENAPMEDTYYRIAYVGEKPYNVEMPDGLTDLVLVNDPSGNATTVNTVMKGDWPETGTYTIDCGTGIRIIYENVAIDANGKLHNIVITVKKITFKDLDKVPRLSDKLAGVTYAERTHDANVADHKVLADGQAYYRPVLQATKEDGVILQNYIRAGTGADPNRPGSGNQMLTGGSGTDVEFTISIEDANKDTSFVFLAKDLDVGYSQNWIHSANGDACFDSLPVENVTYGKGGEGFELLDGVRKETVQFAPETGLYKSGNMVLSTGGDPNTPWSEFTVTCDAEKGGTLKWTSGISCTSYILQNTVEQHVGEITIAPQLVKELLPGGLESGQFTFTLKDVSSDPAGIPAPSNGSQEKQNAADGTVTFDGLVFKANGENAAISGSDSFPYFPGTGTDPANTHGNGVHNGFTYTYEIREKAGSDPNILYDDAAHTLVIRIVPPENDTELKQGIKAELYLDGKLKHAYWHSKSYTSVATGTIKDQWYDASGKSIKDPNPIRIDGLSFQNQKIPVTEEMTVTRTITYTELTPDGKQVADDKVQTGYLKKTWYRDSAGDPVDADGNPVDPETLPWTIDAEHEGNDQSAVTSPDHPKKKTELWNPDYAKVDEWLIDLKAPKDETVHVLYKRDTFTETTEQKTVRRTITYTELTPDGKEVAKAVIQEVVLERSVRTNDRTGESTYGNWKIKKGSAPAVSSPDHPKKAAEGWNPDRLKVDPWEIDLKDPKDETVSVLYTKDTYTETTEQKTVRRIITYTELTPDGKKVAEPVEQTVILERIRRVNDRTGEVSYGLWTVKGDGAAAVTSPKRSGWLPDRDSVPAWTPDPSDPRDETIHVIYAPDKGAVPDTGDGTGLLLWARLLALSGTVLIAAVCGRRKGRAGRGPR